MPLSGQQIYENFQHGRGSTGLCEAAGVLRELAGSYHARTSDIEQLASSMGELWSGSAGSTAGQGARPLAQEFDTVAPDLRSVGDLVQRQASSFDSAKSSVQWVPEPPDKPGVWDNLLTAEGTYTTYRAQLAAHQAAAQHNVDVMNNYTLATDINTKDLPGLVGQAAGGPAETSTAGGGSTTPSVPAPSGVFSGQLPAGEPSGTGLASPGGAALGPGGNTPEQQAVGARSTTGVGLGTSSSSGGSAEETGEDHPDGATPLGGTPHSGEDGQEWSSFLSHSDADEVFGTDEPTAPPVIGE